MENPKKNEKTATTDSVFAVSQDLPAEKIQRIKRMTTTEYEHYRYGFFVHYVACGAVYKDGLIKRGYGRDYEL